MSIVTKVSNSLKLYTPLLPSLNNQTLNYKILLLFGEGRPENSKDSVIFPKTEKVVFSQDCEPYMIAMWTTPHIFPNLKEIWSCYLPQNGLTIPFMNRFQKIDNDHILHSVFGLSTQKKIALNVVDMPLHVKPVGNINRISNDEFLDVMHEFSSEDIISKRGDVIMGKFDEHIFELKEFKQDMPEGVSSSFNWINMSIDMGETETK